MEEDWDLQAVVRGGGYGRSFDLDFADIMMNNNPPPVSLFSPLMSPDDNFQGEFLSFQGGEVFGTATTTTRRDVVVDGLEGLCSPYYPVLHHHHHHHQQPNISPQSSVLSTTTSMPVPKKLIKEDQKKEQLLSESNGGDEAASASPPAAKSKKSKKNQHKKVVQQVTADGISCDMWAWRKYGQKPIKGSPYPRSYYRCSSQKGCLARKQVERSSTDPSLFIITYTAEHSHAHPPRRHSLAGSTRNKSNSTPKQAVSNESNMTPSKADENHCSPTYSMTTSNIEEDRASIKMEEVQEQALKDFGSGEIVVPDIIFSDELFPSLEDMEGLLLDQFAGTFPLQ